MPYPVSGLRGNIWSLLKDLALYKIVTIQGSGAPVDGTTGKYIAGLGSTYVDRLTGNHYVNTGTVLVSVWRPDLVEASAQSTDTSVPTTGNTDSYITAPKSGKLSSAAFAGIDALAAHGTNYVTFSLTNLGQDGSGTAAMLGAVDANTTKTTTGTATVANGRRALTLNTTAANLVTVKGDRILCRVASAATMANTIAKGQFQLHFIN